MTLNNLQWLIRHKTQTKPKKPLQFKSKKWNNYSNDLIFKGGMRSTMVTITVNRIGDLSSNPEWGWLHFATIFFGKAWIDLFSPSYRQITRRTGLVWLYGISTIVDYLMPKLVDTYISDIWFVNISQITLLTSMSSFLHTVKLFQVLLCNSNNLTSVICFHTFYSIWSIDRTLPSATTPG